MIIVLVLAKILALILLKDFQGKILVRALILMPYVAPISLGVIGWLWMLDSIYSPINWLLQHTGLVRVRLLANVAGQAEACHDSHHYRPRLAHVTPGNGHHAGRTYIDSARHPGCGPSGWSRLFPAAIPDHHSDDASHYDGGRPFRHCLHRHGYYHYSGAHPRRALWFHPGPGEQGFLSPVSTQEIWPPEPPRPCSSIPLLAAVAIFMLQNRPPSGGNLDMEKNSRFAQNRWSLKIAHLGSLAVFALFASLPFLWMLITTFKQDADLI